MTVDDIYSLMKYIVAKNTQQGYLSPQDFNIVINQAQRGYFDFLLGEYQRYQVKRPIAVVSFGQNENIRTSLAPLIYSALLVINNITGISGYPSDFERVDAMWGEYGFYNIRFTEQDRLASNYHSVIDPVQTNPVYLIREEGFQFYPETLGRARMSYVRTPPSIIWGYVLDFNGRPVYNAATSQQSIWAESDIFQIVVRALQMVGVNLQFSTVLQYANEIKNAGQ